MSANFCNVQRCASDKLADDSLVLQVCGLSREKEFWQIVSNHTFVNDKLMFCKLSKCLYKYSY